MKPRMLCVITPRGAFCCLPRARASELCLHNDSGYIDQASVAEREWLGFARLVWVQTCVQGQSGRKGPSQNQSMQPPQASSLSTLQGVPHAVEDCE